MKYLKSTFLLAVMAMASVQAHAGIWESITKFFSSIEDAAPAVESLVEVTAPAQDEKEISPSKIEAGIQLIPLITQALGVTGGQAEGA
ncbi:MAG: hypothetical protein ACI9Y1_000521 [Lentisphaeria bacterium]|jgi:hypothetical protein